jgi:murein DD-endopeptidase MepM/ murein hydrolase activator NlpD
MRVSPFTGKKQFHTGIDIAGWKGTPIVAPAKGKVIFVRKNGSLGLTVRIRHNAVYETEYGHLLKAAVKKGQDVERGEIVAYLGNSGRSTGYHLHYEVHKNGKCINPFHHMMDWDENHFFLAQE